MTRKSSTARNRDPRYWYIPARMPWRLREFDKRFGEAALEAHPGSRESSCIALGREKTASLFYDRVWSPFSEAVPNTIRFFGGTDCEKDLVMLAVPSADSSKPRDSSVGEFLSYVGHTVDDGSDETKYTRPCSRVIAEALYQKHRYSATPVYRSSRDQNAEYTSGDRAVAVASLSNLEIPDENALHWEQVEELRKDSRCKINCRRLIHWLDDTMVGKHPEYIADHLAVTLDNYRSALRKHGISTVMATVSATLGSISVPAVVAHITEHPWWVSLAAGVALAGATVAKIAEHHIKLTPPIPDEIALVLSLRSKDDASYHTPTSRT